MKRYQMKQYWKKMVSLLMAMVLMLSLAGCAGQQNGQTSDQQNGQTSDQQGGQLSGQQGEQPSGQQQALGQSVDLMMNTNFNTVEVKGRETDEAFAQAMAEFAVKLFQNQHLAGEDQTDGSTLLSPMSIMLALAMTANGAVGETRTQMEALLGGDISLKELNEYLYTYVKNLPYGEKYKLQIANAIWFRDVRLTVHQEFLQTNHDYYQADARKAPFDDSTLQEINSWVKENTDGLIDSILQEIPQEAVMYLLNAMVFDAQWEEIYNQIDIHDGTFTAYDGTEQTVSMMSSEESRYIDDGNATGFIKYYAGKRYAFAALLPDEGVDIQDYIAGLTGEGLLEAISNAESAHVDVIIPKFSYDYSITMNDVLGQLGMSLAFDGGLADFSLLGESPDGNIYIGNVFHKTFISVDEQGTKAGASTAVEVMAESAVIGGYTVNLNRPFVYAIVDTATGIPLFIGNVMEIEPQE